MVGCGLARLKLEPSDQTPDGTIGLSASAQNWLGIPVGLPLQVDATPGSLRLGPVVGIIGAKEPEDLTEGRLGALKNHLLAYPDHGGLFVCTTPGQISIDHHRVSGYIYSPSGGGGWAEGTCVLPAVILRRFGVPLGPLTASLDRAGVRVTNERTLNKAEAAEWMAADSQVSHHLPETIPYTDLTALLELLDRHGSVFVKPIWGSLAKSIVRLERVSDRINVQTPNEKADLQNVTDLPRLLPRGRAIVQQALDLAKVGDRLIDFRVITQRDGRGRWVVSGIFGRCGESGLIVSNMSTGGFPLSVNEGLSLLFGHSPQGIFRRAQELTQLGLSVGRSLENSGLLVGDLGIDIAYDKQGFPWVIEANNRDPDHNIAWEANDWSTFFNLRTRPTRFCTWLDGFVGEGG